MGREREGGEREGGEKEGERERGREREGERKRGGRERGRKRGEREREGGGERGGSEGERGEREYGGSVAEFCKETDCLEALLFVSNFTGGLSSGKTHTADCCFVSGSYWYTQVSSPATMSQTRGDLPPSKLSLHVGPPIHPTPLVLDTQVMGHPTGTTFPYAKAVVKNASETSR